MSAPSVAAAGAPRPMRRLLAALPLVVLAAAALEAYLARRAAAYRPVEARLFLEAIALWGAFALLALAPAWAWLKLRGRATPERGATLRAGLALAFFAAAPVVAHAALDAYSIEGRGLQGLDAPRPWLAAAGAVLALGAALWVAGRLGARVPGAALALGIVVVAVPVGLWLPPREAPPEVAAADASGKPNLLLLVWDTCRADATAPYGYDRGTTPRLAELADQALVFESARSATIFTFTSHLSMLTGVMPSQHGARMLRSRYDPRRAQTLPAILREHGYRTGGFVGTDVLAGRTGIRHGFEVYSDLVDPPVCDTYAWSLVHDVQSVLALYAPAFRRNGRPHWFQDFQRPADGVLAEAEAWIANGDPRPWFCMINLYDVHWPYLPAEREREEVVRPYDGALDGYLFRSDAYPEGHQPTADDRRHVRDLYDAEVLQLDRTVDRFLARIDLEDTAVLLTADHGEAFGEAGTWMHEHLHEPQLSVPFVLRLPGGERRGRVEGWVSGVDVAPTLLGVAGVPAPEGLAGLDLSQAAPPADRLIRVEDADSFDPKLVRLAVFRGHWKLVREGAGDAMRYHLYDLSKDPVGEVDVGERFPEVKAELVREMEALWQDFDRRLAEESVDLGGQGNALEALGYMEGREQEPEDEVEDP